jgi:hypothetical protein
LLSFFFGRWGEWEVSSSPSFEVRCAGSGIKTYPEELRDKKYEFNARDTTPVHREKYLGELNQARSDCNK